MDETALAEAIQRAQKGDPAAFDLIVEAFGHRLAGYFFRLTGSRQDVEDLVQEVMVRVVRMIGSYQHEARFEAWIFRIATNLARDRARRAKRSPTFVQDGTGRTADENTSGSSATDALVACDETGDARMQRREEIDALNVALSQLPEIEREVIMLRHFSQMSFKEIAQITGAPIGTALARAHRGLAHLRELMDEHARSC